MRNFLKTLFCEHHWAKSIPLTLSEAEKLKVACVFGEPKEMWECACCGKRTVQTEDWMYFRRPQQ